MVEVLEVFNPSAGAGTLLRCSKRISRQHQIQTTRKNVEGGSGCAALADISDPAVPHAVHPSHIDNNEAAATLREGGREAQYLYRKRCRALPHTHRAYVCAPPSPAPPLSDPPTHTHTGDAHSHRTSGIIKAIAPPPCHLLAFSARFPAVSQPRHLQPS